MSCLITMSQKELHRLEVIQLNIDIICANTPAGQGPGGTCQPDVAGSVGQGDAASRHRHD